MSTGLGLFFGGLFVGIGLLCIGGGLSNIGKALRARLIEDAVKERKGPVS